MFKPSLIIAWMAAFVIFWSGVSRVTSDTFGNPLPSGYPASARSFCASARSSAVGERNPGVSAIWAGVIANGVPKRNQSPSSASLRSFVASLMAAWSITIESALRTLLSSYGSRRVLKTMPPTLGNVHRRPLRPGFFPSRIWLPSLGSSHMPQSTTPLRSAADSSGVHATSQMCSIMSTLGLLGSQ